MYGLNRESRIFDTPQKPLQHISPVTDLNVMLTDTHFIFQLSCCGGISFEGCMLCGAMSRYRSATEICHGLKPQVLESLTPLVGLLMS
jgi:hypothetical protein